jgi:cell division septal protein FtsQ
MGAEFMVLLWKNKRLILEILAVLALLGFLWWAMIYQPRKIKALTSERDQAISQKEAAFAAINMLGEINKVHAEIDKESADNENKIRNSRKPGVRGVFIPSGLLDPKMYSAYSTAGPATPGNDKGTVRP